MIEYLIIAVLVIWSAVVVFKKVFPKTSNSVFSKMSIFCEQHGWQRLSQCLKPKIASGCAGGCGCSVDDKPISKNVEVKPVKWN
ncbi:DUF6587 family protein [Acinetobacter ihumii]|uniref:DUF6587 family protein n=1 Tax=Acinetobacter ihumii TaxID=2483802 RepID=UPI0010304558|nr:DUF6587 family protein [Acinetobacter ihumii]